MGLFYKRPLAMFCFIFLFVSLITWRIPELHSLLSLVLFGAVALVLFILTFIIKRFHVKIVTLCICAVVVFSALIHSFVFVSLPQKRAEKYLGERKVLCKVIDDEYFTDDLQLYHIKIDSIDGEDVDIRATLLCNFAADIRPGDYVYGIADVEAEDDTFTKSKGILLSVYMNDPERCFVKHASAESSILSSLFSEGGISIISDRINDKIRDILVNEFGKEKGILALGFFTGIREDMPTDITRDFRRAGVSHLMAVSGSHIAILLGGIELLLRKLRIKKQIRCVFVSLFGIVFLFFAGFSPSACRSVIMLYAVYLGFFFYEDGDSLTSLFVSILLIVLMSPFAIVDLGLWMSFLATLGLLTAYPVFEERLPYPRNKKGIVKRLFLFSRELLLIALMTVVSNAFLLPIIWYFFGEFSLVAVLGNILVGGLSSVFLVLVPVFLIFCRVPFLSSALSFAVSAVGDIILFLVRVCSRLPSATVSLKYGFCYVIMIIFTIAMVILLGIKLKHKGIIAIPFLGAVISFAVCLLITNIFFNKPTVTYISDERNNEMFVVKSVDSMSVCDNSSGSYYFGSVVLDELKLSTATEIETYLLTHYHDAHVKTMDIVTSKVIVRNIYLPIPTDNESLSVAARIRQIAIDSGANLFFYEDRERLEMSGISVSVDGTKNNGKGSFIGFFGDEVTVLYSSPVFCREDFSCDTLIVGSHEVDKSNRYELAASSKNIIIASADIYEKLDIKTASPLFFPIDQGYYSKSKLPLYKKDK